jgi:hypothetical protein
MASHGQTTDTGGNAGRHTMPAGIRLALLAAVALLLASALYLIAVRGEALLASLAALAQLCF